MTHHLYSKSTVSYGSLPVRVVVILFFNFDATAAPPLFHQVSRLSTGMTVGVQVPYYCKQARLHGRTVLYCINFRAVELESVIVPCT